MKQIEEYCFQESVKDCASHYIAYKRALGYKVGYYDQKSINRMLLFIYNNESTNNLSNLTEEIVKKYLDSFSSAMPRTIHAAQSLIRQYGLYLKLNGYTPYIFSGNLIKCSESFTPYIFSKNEISQIIRISDAIPERRRIFGKMAIVYPAIFRTLYCCGTRISETLNLKTEDVNLEDGLLTLYKGKNNVSRIIPISESLLKYLRHYNSSVVRNNNDYFFPSFRNECLAPCTVLSIFKECLKYAGIGPLASGGYPRIHDLRHTFAVHSLEYAINNGLDPYCCLPSLSVYMGHKGVESTEYYLRLTKHYFTNVLQYTEKQADKIFPGVN